MQSSEAEVDADAQAGRRFQLAPVFDHVDPVTGPSFAADHPVIEDPAVKARILRRLEAGTLVLASPMLMDDILDPASEAVVPMNYRTDGAWIWTDTVAYYLRVHGLAPAAELLGQLERSGDEPRPLSRADAEAAVAFLLAPPETQDAETVWTVD
jgi:hypothetical protein